MTFEIEFNFNDAVYKADVTSFNRDLLVNFNSPKHYATLPTIVFTIHDDGSMNYDQNLFEEKTFMPAIEAAITNYLRTNSLHVD